GLDDVLACRRKRHWTYGSVQDGRHEHPAREKNRGDEKLPQPEPPRLALLLDAIEMMRQSVGHSIAECWVLSAECRVAIGASDVERFCIPTQDSGLSTSS